MTTTLRYRSLVALLFIYSVCPQAAILAQSTASISGQVNDSRHGEPLPFATAVLMRGGFTTVYAGSSADANGRYSLTGLRPGRYALLASYVGYEEQMVEFELNEGESRVFDFALQPSTTLLDPVVVTGSPRPEKSLDAPAAVSVLSAREIEQHVASSSSEALRGLPGVDMARTGIDRREIVIRGFSRTFSGATYVMTDYRQSAIASLGVNAYNMMPISSIDLDRIEVVRGPASAVYGAGVDAGVIHFITKDPFTYPGTSIALSGGQQSLAQGELRHAGVVDGRFGYKFTGQYLRAEDWQLNCQEPHDKDICDRYHGIIARDTDVQKLNATGTVAYRVNPTTTLTAVGGYGTARSPFLSDIGILQSKGFGYRFGQLRLHSGRLFAQASLNANDAGDSFVYAGPQVPPELSGAAIIDRSTQLNLQAQYGLDLARGREQITFGVDFEQTNPSTSGTITGRNEGKDRILEYGAYAQSQTRLSEKWNLTLAARLDYDNVYEKLQFSPRTAIVYKPAPGHALRATYNRAFDSPGSNSLFLDIVAREPDAMLPLRVRGRGAAGGYTFLRNPAFAAFSGSDLVASSLNPASPGQPQPVGMPIDVIYGGVYKALSDACSAGVCPFPEDFAEELVRLLAPDKTVVQGFSRGSLSLLNLTTGQVDPISTVSDIAPLEQTSTQTIELGYKD